MEQLAKNQTKKTVERSSRYPAVDIESAIELIKKLKANLGSGPYARLSVAQGIGYDAITGSSGKRVAALVYYGLLEKSGQKYSLSDLANRILYEISAEDRKEAIVEAVKKPTIFSALIDRYKGEALPALLKNILVREYQIVDKVADDVIRNFTSSLQFADLLKNGIILDSSERSSINLGSQEDNLIQTQDQVDTPIVESEQNQESLGIVSLSDMERGIASQSVDIDLENGGRARIIVPNSKDLTLGDVKKMKVQIDIFSNFIDRS